MNKFKLIIAIVVVLILSTTISEGQHRKGIKVAPRENVRGYHRVVVRRAHVRYSAFPRWGTTVTVVPAHAVSIMSRRTPYYYHSGVFYTPRNNGFVVVRPARGLRIAVLPTGYRTVLIGPRQYYYYYGTFYAERGPGSYEVVDAPQHAIVDALPDGYEVVQINGLEYYLLDGVYYAEVDAPEFEDGIGYQVVKI